MSATPALESLFLRYRAEGDLDALGSVFLRCHAPLRRHAARFAARHDAEDLVQATFLTAMQCAAAFDPGRPLLSWLRGILGNVARRQLARSRRGVSGGGESTGGSTLDGVLRAETRRAVADGLSSLSEPYRQTLLLHLEHGLHAVQIADRTGIPAGTVRCRIVRGKRALRRLLPADLTPALVGAMSPDE